jgi:hypothetical protein
MRISDAPFERRHSPFGACTGLVSRRFQDGYTGATDGGWVALQGPTSAGTNVILAADLKNGASAVSRRFVELHPLERL